MLVQTGVRIVRRRGTADDSLMAARRPPAIREEVRASSDPWRLGPPPLNSPLAALSRQGS